MVFNPKSISEYIQVLRFEVERKGTHLMLPVVLSGADKKSGSSLPSKQLANLYRRVEKANIENHPDALLLFTTLPISDLHHNSEYQQSCFFRPLES